ncbi:MAG: hypothetical protein OSJ63_07745 [Bacilli bacterium]|nr:hypothetical protein [Bacilli bacterium]
MKNTYDGILYACATGKQKNWARETLIMDMLYSTADNKDCAYYLMVNNKELLQECDSEDNECYRYSFGYLNRLPKTQVDLCVDKKNNKLYLEKVGVGFGYDEVEKVVYKFIEKQIKDKNLFIRTNFNDNKFLIK